MNANQLKLVVGILSGRINTLTPPDLKVLGLGEYIYAELDRGVSIGRNKWFIQHPKTGKEEGVILFSKLEELLCGAFINGINKKTEEEIAADINDFFTTGK